MGLMTSLLGSKNPNPSLATILMPTESFAQKRADKQADMAYTQRLFELEQQRLQEKQAQEKKIRDNFNYVNTLDILEPDKKRLQVFSDSLEQKIIDKIKNKYGGNIRKYMMEEGEADLYDYQKSLISSEYMRDALTNKTNKGQYDIADVDGKIHRRTSWTTSSGEKKVGTFEEAYLDYANFKTQKLNYAGAYESPKKVNEYFSKTYSPRGWYEGDEPTREEVFAAYVGAGLSPEDAADYYDRYYSQGMYRYKAGDIDAYNLKIAGHNLKVADAELDRVKFDRDQYWKQMNYNLSKQRLNEQGRHNKEMEKKSSGGAGGYDYWRSDLQGLYDKNGNLVDGSTVNMDASSLQQAMGAADGKNARPLDGGKAIIGDLKNPTKEIEDLPAVNVYSTGKVQVRTEADGSKAVYEQVRITMDKQQAIDTGLVEDKIIWGQDFQAADKVKKSVVKSGDEYIVTAWIEMKPSNTAGLAYSRAVGGKTLEPASGYPAVQEQQQEEDYSESVELLPE